MNIILLAILSLGGIGAIGALILYFASKKFYVYEDQRIAQIQEILPAANCGACGFPGCSGFASALAKADTLDNFYCPVGGSATMDLVADILRQSVQNTVQQIAVVKCNGNCSNRAKTNYYDGASSCAIASNLYGGDTDCSFGCLGYGDCVKVCPFDAIHINDATQLPEVNEDKCTACGKCVKACPKSLIELRKKGPKSRRIYVSCMNKDKPAVAMKSCKVSCIACKKCMKACPFEAITIENNLAYIDDNKCRLCRKCVPECPNSTIIELNFPIKKEKVENV
ncbi:MAG: Fe-S cluster domain-containing protein [Bacteroidales bacterium]|nr:Fe-S cluster domain-containing protein [Bacteroidales bacterium]